jgi:hypothetical protein
VFLTAILVVGGCKSTTEQEATETIKDSNKVKIYLKIKKINGKRYFSMYDSNDPKKVVEGILEEGQVTTIKLTTFVNPGMTVIWKRKLFSGIRQINKIVTTKGVGRIITEDPKIKSLGKGFKLTLDKEIWIGDDEEYIEDHYIIEFIDRRDKERWTIDPYLRVKP